jgi:YfiR/HmsC-like
MPFLSAFVNQKAMKLLQLALTLTLLFATKSEASAQADVSTEYKFKAVFLFHFAQFVDWPTNALPAAKSPLIIGVLGDNPFGNFLNETVQGENVNGHPLVVQHYRQLNDATNCQVLFISHSEEKRLGQILTNLNGKTVLTVSDINGFPEDGGIIGFVTVHDKIHFKINTNAAKDAHLEFSSKLLRLAEIVTPENK